MSSDLRYVELAGEDLAGYLVHVERSYAQDMHELGGVPVEEARERARQSTLELFPDGLPAEGNQLWRAVDGDGEPVGVLWLAHRAKGTPGEHAWIYDIEVEPGRRGQGHGRTMMHRAEEITREWGLTLLRLNVFGDNEVARNLYRSQGFHEEAVIMSKAL
jgi:ribosomal protein S18 acetylase RimI-like enzyme